MSRESELVELVNARGIPTGITSVELAHHAPGALHRAFSVVLIDEAGRLLLQQRAEAKTRFALRWANSCCGHPPPAASVGEAARQRVAEELGCDIGQLNEAGTFIYQARDEVTGRVEHEFDHVLVGRVGAALELKPDPAEVASVRWVGATQARQELDASPERFAPWWPHVLEIALGAL
ncbi:MAG: isopentenyl-diphosphate Delta-isomerase [Corynebacteriales bacterium]|nr:isopentenyl-diphosphate Delta-isomerase [Mycobacteriales bacterium]